MKVTVDFEPVGRRGACTEGSTLLECARLLGVDLVNLCGGSGSCGRCIIQIVEGDVSPPTEGEGDFLSSEQLAQGFRLACRAMPLGPVKVRVPPESLTTPQRTQVEGEEIPVTPNPLVRTYTLSLTEPDLEDLRADAERLLDTLHQEHGLQAQRTDLTVLKTLSPTLRSSKWQVQVAVREDEVMALLPIGTRPLGLAVDLGTTKVAGYLLDLESGQTLASKGMMNPQISYGEDVIARLSIADQSPAQAANMQSLVAETLNQLAANLCAEIGASARHIVDAVVVGNTAMHHLFVGLPAGQLALAPYVPAVAQSLDIKARDLGLQLAGGAYVHLLPNIAGYVGADHVAMMLATGANQAQGVVLALDIGTNTEVYLYSRGRLTSTSCASGPAFEGAHIKHGMRAANGAIERVRILDSTVEYQTIGAAPPVGLCGSGILDVLAQLHKAGIVDRRGRMLDHERVRGEKAKREFVLVGNGDTTDGHRDVTFTQKDVRELQLAKGAMRTGIQMLLETNDLSTDEIDEVIIAGAFGTYIDVESAITVGMLPRLPLERFRQVGNAAGMGAKLALISREKRAEAQSLATQTGYLELAANPTFQKTFAQSMYLGEDIFS